MATIAFVVVLVGTVSMVIFCYRREAAERNYLPLQTLSLTAAVLYHGAPAIFDLAGLHHRYSELGNSQSRLEVATWSLIAAAAFALGARRTRDTTATTFDYRTVALRNVALAFYLSSLAFALLGHYRVPGAAGEGPISRLTSQFLMISGSLAVFIIARQH
ncbi:MAG: hypothetical protein R2733_26900, partial [Acidimicrobiales bacterium]